MLFAKRYAFFLLSLCFSSLCEEEFVCKRWFRFRVVNNCQLRFENIFPGDVATLNKGEEECVCLSRDQKSRFFMQKKDTKGRSRSLKLNDDKLINATWRRERKRGNLLYSFPSHTWVLFRHSSIPHSEKREWEREGRIANNSRLNKEAKYCEGIFVEWKA